MRITAEIEGGVLVIRVPLAEFPLTGNVRITPRESQVLDLLCAGRCDKEIARVMNLSLSGVKHHVGNLLKKFGVRSRQEVVIARLTNRAADSIVSASTAGCSPSGRGKNHHGDDAAQL
jgi:DNA-binding CsgD family transcriptional regulator